MAQGSLNPRLARLDFGAREGVLVSFGSHPPLEGRDRDLEPIEFDDQQVVVEAEPRRLR
jgi:hypothetical protein